MKKGSCSANPKHRKPLTPDKLGDWQDLENPALGLNVFQHTDYAFDPRVNEPYHARRVIHIAYDARISDYSPKLENAFAELSRTGGGTVQLGVGVFEHSRNVIIPSYCCLRGSGMDSTTLKVGDSCPAYKVAGAIRTRCTRHVTVRDLTQDGNATQAPAGCYGRYGVYTHLASFVWLYRVRCRSNYTYALDPHGDKGPPPRWSFYLVVEECVSERNGLDGITVDQSMYVSVLRCVCKNNARHGVNVVTGSRYVLVKGCRLELNGAESGNGFGLVAQNNDTRGKFGTHSVIFAENSVRSCYKGAVALRDVHNITVTRNVFEQHHPTEKYVVYEMNGTKHPTALSGNVVQGRAPREVTCKDGAEYCKQ